MLSPCGALVQRHDPERFVAALFAPAAARETLFTLYAFNHELARAREVASQPMLALIRLAWWREVVDGAVRPHEVATPLQAAIAAGLLDAAVLAEMVEARMLEAEESLDADHWQACVTGSAGALMREAGRVLGAPMALHAALTRLGAGCGAVGLLRNRRAHAAQHRWTAPIGHDAGWVAARAADWLGAPRRWPNRLVAAALPAIFARRQLARWTRNGADAPFADPVADLWGRIAVWAGARSGRA